MKVLTKKGLAVLETGTNQQLVALGLPVPPRASLDEKLRWLRAAQYQRRQNAKEQP